MNELLEKWASYMNTDCPNFLDKEQMITFKDKLFNATIDNLDFFERASIFLNIDSFIKELQDINEDTFEE